MAECPTDFEHKLATKMACVGMTTRFPMNNFYKHIALFCKGPSVIIDGFRRTNDVRTWVVGWGPGRSDKYIESLVDALIFNSRRFY